MGYFAKTGTDGKWYSEYDHESSNVADMGGALWALCPPWSLRVLETSKALKPWRSHMKANVGAVGARLGLQVVGGCQPSQPRLFLSSDVLFYLSHF